MKKIEQIKAKFSELAKRREIIEIETTYGSIEIVKGSNLRLEHHTESVDYKFSMIADANIVLFDIQH